MTSSSPPNPPRRLGHRRRAPISPQGRRRRSGERGYVIVMTALLLIPLMGFTAFAVDVGGWYARAAQIQRAADAAALAGAARMPDFDTAEDVALETAEKNGFVQGGEDGDISIDVEPAGERRVEVTISDSDVARYFSSMFVDNMSLSRDSLAEFVLPVPLGSPEDYFGNVPGEHEPGLWANIAGPRNGNYQGDRYAAGCRNGSGNCSPLTNEEYRGFYYYAIDIPPGAGQTDIQIYDAGLYNRGPQDSTGDNNWSNTGTFVTGFELYDDEHTTPGEYDDASPLWETNKCTLPQDLPYGEPGRLFTIEEYFASTYRDKWATICRMNSAPSGRYWLKVSSKYASADGQNRYSVRVSTSGTDARISAFGDMSMYNNELDVNPEFYLAKVAPLHRGKHFLVYLYDPGEIGVPNAEMQVLTPDGSVADYCSVNVYDNPTDYSSSEQVNASPCSIATTNGSGSPEYNTNLLLIELEIPTDYDCGDACWWKIRYDLGGATSGGPSDVTTWSAAIRGDPVHLVEEDENVAGG